MASIRPRRKADGTEYWQVLYRLDGQQTSTSFGDFTEATQFADLAKRFGIENAIAAVDAQQRVTKPDGFTVARWLTHHVDHLSGGDVNTADKYRAYIRNDVDQKFGPMPLLAVTRDDVAKWVQRLQLSNAEGKVSSAKTVTNKHGLWPERSILTFWPAPRGRRARRRTSPPHSTARSTPPMPPACWRDHRCARPFR